MKRPTLQHGASGIFVEQLQHRLIFHGLSLAPAGADGDFGILTDRRVREFQKREGLKVDGVVGDKTWDALDEKEKAFERALDDDTTEEFAWGHPWGHAEPIEHKDGPAEPDFAPLRGNAGRQAVFGKFAYKSAGTATNPEGIRFTDDWPDKNIITVHVPQIAAIPGIRHRGKRVGFGPKSGNISVHRLIADQFKAMWQAWEDAGLLHHILTWAGMWNPRFIRGSRSVLSNHCLPAEQCVWTSEGSAPIGDLQDFGGTVWSFQDGIVAPGWVTNFFRNGKRPLLRVRADGHEVVCTDNHPFLVLRKRTLEKHEWIQHEGRRGQQRALYWTEMVRADQLCLGDRLVVATNSPGVVKANYSVNGDWAEILGLFVGDGCVNHRSGEAAHVTFNMPTSKKTRTHAADLIARYFKKTELRQDARALFLYKQEEYRQFLPYDRLANHKRVPPEVWKWPAVAQVRFLLGYLYTDGWITADHSSSGGGHSARFGVKAASERLVRELRQLFAGLGFRLSNVSFTLPEDDLMICGRPTRSNGSWGFHATDIRRVLRPTADPLYLERVKNASVPNSGRSRAMGYELVAPDFTHRAVRSIQWQGREADVFDIEVDHHHNFVTDGVVVSNSFATAFDINAPFNGLGAVPAVYGKRGCVRELVPIAHEYAFFWGGHFNRRPDGMHFEAAKVI